MLRHCLTRLAFIPRPNLLSSMSRYSTNQCEQDSYKKLLKVDEYLFDTTELDEWINDTLDDPYTIKDPHVSALCLRAMLPTIFPIHHITNEQKRQYIDDYLDKDTLSKYLLDKVSHNGLLLKDIMDIMPEFATNNLYDIAVIQNGLALQFIPESGRTYELCLKAVKQNGLALQFVPENIKTIGMCDAAIESTHNKDVHKYITFGSLFRMDPKPPVI